MEKSQKILETLESWGIEYKMIEHAPALGMEDLPPIVEQLDPEKKIQLVIDADVLNWERACMHPGVNTRSLAMSMADFKQTVLPRLGHEPIVLEITGGCALMSIES